ncbi:MAG: hypothetical protein CFH15_00850 [Alphaproteobacteria bacterium MarineAlpha5_Bin5]|nr:MAG: hypothetical protein CFH15_00850 [Alphaproteobacteria bacterium MarineAlpha5_Bin5]PPR51301.1 MAG: hypothetical protein CFH14_00734 [Alphaproteobacteria bacterium MarineAlpha5_Bin4]|tara:strand:- start:671 stop:925 length:255 start_codon:yes stop_codon:yes gene_type:complete
MERKKRIYEILKKKLVDFTIEVEDNSYKHKGHNNFDGSDETHILVILKRNYDKKVNRLETHRFINNLLKDEFKQGLHALEIKII